MDKIARMGNVGGAVNESITYVVDGLQYMLSYQDLKAKHEELCALTDASFLERLPEALHLACMICYLKETPSYICLSDTGIIHELVHLLHIKDEPLVDLETIRKSFQETLLLK